MPLTPPKIGRFYSAVFLFLLLVLMHREVEGARIVRVGVFENKPIVFLDESGEISGVYGDLIREVALRHNWELEYVSCSWPRCLELLIRGDIDLMTSIAQNEKRDRFMDFSSENVLMMWGQVYLNPSMKVQNILDMQGLKVAVLKDGINGINFRKLCSAFDVACEFIEVGSQKEVFELTQSGETDAGVLNNVFGRLHETDYNVELSPIFFSPFSLLFAVPEGKHEDLITTIDNQLVQWKSMDDSVYHRTLAQWFQGGQKILFGIPQWVVMVLAIGLAIVVSLFCLLKLMQIQVRRKTEALQLANTKLQRQIEEKRALQEQLHHAMTLEAMGTMAGGITHDFNNILAPVIGYSELLQDILPPESESIEYVREIFKGALRARELVKQILNFSRHSEARIEQVDMVGLMDEVMKLCRAIIPSSITLDLEVAQGDHLVMADPTRLHQVAMNLITNAFHAMEGMPGQLRIALVDAVVDASEITHTGMVPGEYVSLSVSDTGVGMDEATLKRIFDPYFTTRSDGKGSGLGLSVVYGVVSGLGGDVVVKSQLGKGSSFTVRLPRSDDPSRPEEFLDSASPEVHGERILLVDDEVAIVRMEKKVLEKAGYHVTEMVKSDDALTYFRKNPDAFDLLLTDMTMPVMCGDELVAKVRAIRPQLPVVICTGYSEMLTQDVQETLGINGVVMKPVTRSELLATLEEVLSENGRS